MLSEPHVVKPWGLGSGELQTWLREIAGADNKGKVKELIDAMGGVDGLTVLNDWVAVGFDGKKPNFGSIPWRFAGRIKSHLKLEKPPDLATISKLSNFFGAVPTGRLGRQQGVRNAGNLSYYKALLRSCENRSPLTDYDWVRTVGEGTFGRAHLCKYARTTLS